MRPFFQFIGDSKSCSLMNLDFAKNIVLFLLAVNIQLLPFLRSKLQNNMKEGIVSPGGQSIFGDF